MKNKIFFILLFTIVFSSPPSSPKNCSLKVRSKSGTPILCDSDPPFPLKMTTTISLTQTIKWKGVQSWSYALEDTHQHYTSLANSCVSGQPTETVLHGGANMTLSINCQRLPRELKKGDKLWIYVFSDQDNPDNWLMYNIPI